MAEYYVYIVECSDGSLYTGYTVNVTGRIKKHNEGLGAKYTRHRRPVVLKYQESFATKSEAMRREAAIKKLPRNEKIRLIGGVG